VIPLFTIEKSSLTLGLDFMAFIINEVLIWGR